MLLSGPCPAWLHSMYKIGQQCRLGKRGEQAIFMLGVYFTGAGSQLPTYIASSNLNQIPRYLRTYVSTYLPRYLTYQVEQLLPGRTCVVQCSTVPKRFLLGRLGFNQPTTAQLGQVPVPI